MLKTIIPKTLCTLITLLGFSLLYGQFYGDITSVQATTTQEGALTDYTITSLAAVDQGSGQAAVAIGQLAAVYFPSDFDLTGVTSMDITIGSTTTPVTGYNNNGPSALVFNMPVALPAGSGFVLQVNQVRNASVNAACGTNVNTYYSSSPCDQQVVVYMMNTLNDTGRPNVFNHFGVPRFTVTAANYFIQEVVVDKPNLSPVFENAAAEEMLRLRIKVGGSLGTQPVLNSLDFSVGSTSLNTITSVDLWTTPTGVNFPMGNDTQLGSQAPSSTTSFTPGRSLNAGNHYFWITYDLACDYGLVGQQLDGLLTNVRIDGQNYNPPTPTGTRSVAQNPTVSFTNLVPNPSFEDLSTCPDNLSQINRTLAWGAIPVTGTNGLASTPDFFHACDQTSSPAAVPTNNFGMQEPRTGDGYAGIYTTGFFDWKEYLQIQLTGPLQAGETYVVTYFVSGGEYDQTSSLDVSLKHSGFGFMLSNNQVTSPNSIYGVPNTVQANYIDGGVKPDEVAWVPVTAQYTAQGGEEWLVIGCFTNWQSLAKVGEGDFGYYYVDDVSVVPLNTVPPTACPALELLIEVTPESCPGANDGTAAVQIFGGNPPFTVTWSDNGVGANRTGLAPGTYNLTVTDANQNTRTDITIVAPATPPNVNMVVNSPSTVGGANGSIQTTVLSGTQPLTYEWSTGSTTPGISNLSARTYLLTITDANNCRNELSAFLGDPLSCNRTHRNFPYEYDTERGLGLFKQAQDDDFNWRRRDAPTPTNNTGPSAAYTGDYYRYLESSGSNKQNKTGVLVTKKCLDISGLSFPVFSFYYNLNGADMGELYVQLSTDGGTTWTGPVWQTSGNQGDNWQLATIYLDAYMSSSLQIRLVGRTGGGSRSDLAIDSYYIGTFTNSFLRSLPAPVVEAEVPAAAETMVPGGSLSSLNVYPNPSSGPCQVSWQQQLPGNVQLRVIDPLGRPVFTQKIAANAGFQETQLQLSLGAGLYRIELTQDGERTIKSLLILP